ncbi:MAG: hypothetical protein CMH54_12880 [Myxococcales bacterium]|nr:hypothetical protein [Myxococcales bacterium]
MNQAEPAIASPASNADTTAVALQRLSRRAQWIHLAMVLALSLAIGLGWGLRPGLSAFAGGGLALANLYIINWIGNRMMSNPASKAGGYVGLFFVKFVGLGLVVGLMILVVKPAAGAFLIGYSTLLPVVFGTTIARGKI